MGPLFWRCSNPWALFLHWVLPFLGSFQAPSVAPHSSACLDLGQDSAFLLPNPKAGSAPPPCIPQCWLHWRIQRAGVERSQLEANGHFQTVGKDTRALSSVPCPLRTSPCPKVSPGQGRSPVSPSPGGFRC